jgi:hypothetical protein
MLDQVAAALFLLAGITFVYVIRIRQSDRSLWRWRYHAGNLRTERPSKV